MKPTSHSFTWHHYDINFTYFPPSRGSRDSLGGIRGAGPPLEPDEPAEVEIERIYDQLEGVEIDPCDFPRREELEQACFDHLQQ